MFSVIVDPDGHKRGPTSSPVVGTKIQRDCNFEAHAYHFSYRLGYICSRWFIILSQLPYNLLVQPYKCIILPGNLNRLIHQDFSRSRSSSGSSTRLCSTAAEPTKCTEHDTIQKGIVQCTVGAVSFSCMLCTIFYNGKCDLS